MKEEIKFKLGDRVYAPFHGYGVVTAIHEDACVYPIEVTWDDSGLKNMEDASTFTADGLLSKYYANTDTILTVVKGSHKRNRRKEMSASKFKVGDRVYNPSHGYGVVTEIKDDEQEYPIVVTWEEKQHGCISIFTPEGFAVKGLNSEDDDLTLVEKASLKGEKEMEECIKLKVGDRVSYPDKGYGIVTAIHAGTAYPIEVTWDKSLKGHEVNTFTKDGFLVISLGDCGDNDKLTVVDKAKGETEMGQIASVAESNIAKKEQEDNEKMGADDEKFQVGDRVYAPFHKYGTVVEIDGTDKSYPITVKWDESRYKIGIDLSTFTEDGYLFFSDKTENTKITKVKKDESTIERMEDALNKKVEDAVNPAHYKVEGLPEAYDIMTHLMNREQLEGFLWGNIIKYAYRYGRKGDEADTAGKIKWYAQKLKELGECESE